MCQYFKMYSLQSYTVYCNTNCNLSGEYKVTYKWNVIKRAHAHSVQENSGHTLADPGGGGPI